MGELTRAQRGVLTGLLVATLGFLVLPTDSTSLLTTYYVGIGTTSVVVVWWSIRRHRPHRPLGWLLVAAGFTAWALGDLVWAAETQLLGISRYPGPFDAVYLSAYLLLAAGLFVMARGQYGTRDRTAALDACIIAVGSGVLAVVIVIQPGIAGSSGSPFLQVVSSAYPICDVLLLVMVARLWSGSRGASSLSHHLLLAAFVVTLGADICLTVFQLTGTMTTPRWLDTMWLLGYFFVAAAATVRSMSRIGAPVPASNRADGGRRRLAALTAGLMLPGVALVVDGLNGDVIAWQVVGIGTMLLSAFVVVRMSGLLEVVEVQSVQLAALARSDPLTGAPNRRTWDHELSRACRHSRDTGDPLCVAILDLDNFKRFNDSFGHKAGDLLLREAVAAWVHRLEDRALLARYGGEEFAVLLPGFSLVEAMAVVQSLAEVMPQAQTFSAGVAAWEPTSEPALAIAHADQALHVAKRNGRDRVVVHPGGGADPVDESGLPAYSVLLQPLFDLRTGRVIGHEALCRFDEPGVDPEAGFQLAHDRGWGDLLEVAAIRTAMALPGRPPRTQLYVNVSMTALDSPRFWALLPADLRGVVVELNEAAGPLGDDALVRVVDRLRSRGARIALDDLGAGATELIRLAGLRPDIIKIDRGLVHGCADDPGRAAVISALVAYADILGVLVCAEGLELSTDLRRLRELGVTCVQGFLVAEPGRHWHTAAATALPSQPSPVSG
jgi:diguanylate cyclase (GGDEF)-like protein